MSAWIYDPEANAAYLHLTPDRDTPSVRQEWTPGFDVIVDYSAEGRIIGIEVLGASELLDPRLLEG